MKVNESHSGVIYFGHSLFFVLVERHELHILVKNFLCFFNLTVHLSPRKEKNWEDCWNVIGSRAFIFIQGSNVLKWGLADFGLVWNLCISSGQYKYIPLRMPIFSSVFPQWGVSVASDFLLDHQLVSQWCWLWCRLCMAWF